MGDSLHLVHSEDMCEFVKVFFAQRSGDRVYRDLVLQYHPTTHFAGQLLNQDVRYDTS
jgi:predicted phage-related endonuclease